jgi:uncharacterized protein YdhG (YjbR/CyaY superfamily)
MYDRTMSDEAPSADVDAYFATLPDDRRAALADVRRRIHDAVEGLGERISYQIPATTREGHVVLFFAAWKTHIGLYPIPRFDDAKLEDAVAPFRAAKDTVRFPYKRPIPDGLIEAITQSIVAARSSADR